MATDYDLVIIGGGTGGYVAAIRASQLGLKTAIVENKKLGGTCLHAGCIPSKALLRSAEVFATVKKSAQFGVKTGDVSLDFTKVQERKQTIVDQLHRGVMQLMTKGKIDIYEGYGRILGPSIFSPLPGTISVEMNSGTENEILIPKYVILATGSRPKPLPGLTIDGEYVLTSDHALQMKELPSSIIIIGGGVIGVEWASMLADFDVNVTVIEYDSRLLPLEDEDISKEMQRLLKKKGVTVVTSAKVMGDTLVRGKTVSIQAERNGEMKEYTGDKILVSTGRQANIENLGLSNTDIVIKDGCIETNEYYQTKEPHIYAIGDVIGGLQLAHVASHEGIIAAEHMAGLKQQPINYEIISKCVYSNPEVASVGLTEKAAIERGYKVKTGTFSFRAIGKALVYGEKDGFVKLVVDEDTEDLLGCHMIGPHVTDLISEAGLAKLLDATPWEIGKTIHPHPSLSEAIGEAALAVDGNALHA